MDGVRLLTDPVLRTHVLHLRRVAAPASAPDRVDAVLVSHEHYDHLDINSLRQIGGAPRVVVPAGTPKRVRGGGEDIVEPNVGDQVEVGPVPAPANAALPGRPA